MRSFFSSPRRSWSELRLSVLLCCVMGISAAFAAVSRPIVSDLQGRQLSDARLTVKNEIFSVYLTNRSFILDVRGTRSFRQGASIQVMRNGMTVFVGRSYPSGRIVFLNSVEAVDYDSVFPPQSQGGGSIPVSSAPLTESVTAWTSGNRVDPGSSGGPAVPVSTPAPDPAAPPVIAVRDTAPSEAVELTGTPVISESRIPVSGPGSNFMTVSETRDVYLVKIPDVLFARNKAELSSRARDSLLALSTYLETASGRVTIRGYTDDVGTEEYNLKLSGLRAGAVKKFLVEGMGIPDARIDCEGLGMRSPVAVNSTPEGRSQNRRVTIEIRK